MADITPLLPAGSGGTLRGTPPLRSVLNQRIKPLVPEGSGSSLRGTAALTSRLNRTITPLRPEGSERTLRGTTPLRQAGNQLSGARPTRGSVTVRPAITISYSDGSPPPDTGTSGGGSTEYQVADVYVSAQSVFELDGTEEGFKAWATNSGLVDEVDRLKTIQEVAILSRKAAYNAAIVNVMSLRARQTRLKAVGSEFIRESILQPTVIPPEE